MAKKGPQKNTGERCDYCECLRRTTSPYEKCNGCQQVKYCSPMCQKNIGNPIRHFV